jgi:drug/metabolite transporter (DMT)-like permease
MDVDPTRTTGRSDLLPLLAVVAMTAIWGSTFVIIKDAVADLAIGSFLAVRFAIAALVLLAIRPSILARLDRDALRVGVALGVLYGIAQVLQTWGLAFTSPSVSGFVTAMYVVFTPLILAVVLRRPVGRTAWLAVVIAIAGIGVLSLEGFAIGSGELLTLAASFVYAAHIVALGAWSRGRDALALSFVQLVVVTLVAVASMPLDGHAELPSGRDEWFAVLYTAVFAGSLVLLLQTWAQARIAPTRAAVAMMLEPVFAAGIAVAVGVDDLTTRMVVGGALVLVAMYVVELGPRHGAEAEVVHPGPV